MGGRTVGRSRAVSRSRIIGRSWIIGRSRTVGRSRIVDALASRGRGLIGLLLLAILRRVDLDLDTGFLVLIDIALDVLQMVVSAENGRLLILFLGKFSSDLTGRLENI